MATSSSFAMAPAGQRIRRNPVHTPVRRCRKRAVCTTTGWSHVHWHKATFRLRDGAVLEPPALDAC